VPHSREQHDVCRTRGNCGRCRDYGHLIDLLERAHPASCRDRPAAGGIALINSLRNLSGFVAPSMLGYIKDATKSLSGGLYALAALVVIGVILIVIITPRPATK